MTVLFKGQFSSILIFHLIIVYFYHSGKKKKSNKKQSRKMIFFNAVLAKKLKCNYVAYYQLQIQKVTCDRKEDLNMFKKFILIAFSICFYAVSANAADRLSVFVSIVPQKYFVQQIGKDMVDVKVMVRPGASPHTYEPKPRQMAELADADLYFAIGVQFENVWLRKISAANPGMKVVHTDHGIKKISMTAHHHHDKKEHHDVHHHDQDHHGDKKQDHEEEHHHGKPHGHHDEKEHHGEDHHDHTGLDPHIWTSPDLAKKQAQTILSALQEADPSNKDEYAANYNEFSAQIFRLDQDLRQTFKGKKGLQFMVFHPAWGYFAKEYGLRQVPVEIEGKEPKPAQLKELIEHAKKEKIKVIFVQPQFSTQSAKIVAREIGGQIAFADPLAADWMANLKMIADKFRAALK